MPYMRALFSTMPKEMTEQNVNVITLDIDIHSLQLLVDYAYTGRIGITEENVKSLISAANRLQVSVIWEACYKFLTKRLNPSNCLSIHSYAVQHKFTELAKTAHKYSLEYFKDVVLTKDFLLLSSTEVLNIISNDDLNERNEELVYNAVMTWIKVDLEERERHLEELLPHVRLPLIYPRLLVLKVAKEPLIAGRTFGKDLLFEAMAHHLCPKESKDEITERTTHRIPKGLKPYIFAIGGQYGSEYHKECEYYDSSSGQWSSFAPTAQMRTNAGVLALNGMVYAFGGNDSSNILSSAEIYNPVTNQWTDIKNMITERYDFGVAALNGLVYASGGYDGTSYLNCVHTYDPYVDKWSEISANHIHSRNSHLLGLNGCLYAVGVYYDGRYLSALERMDPREGKWHSMPDMSIHRFACGFAALDDVLYVVGGYNHKNGYMSSGERFDTISHKWEPIPSMPSNRSGLQLVECETQLYALGGQNESYEDLETVVSYEPSTQIWSSVPSMALKRNRLGAAVLKCSDPITDC